MELYCVQCDGYHKSQKFDHTLALCKRCAKPFKKGLKTAERIMAHYSDVSVGDLMWFQNSPVIVLQATPTGWVVKDTTTNRDYSIKPNMFDVFENFVLIFRRFGDDEKS